MTARLYPQYKDTLRIDGRLLTLAEYVDETCGQRIGPAASACLAEAQERGRWLLAREQGRSSVLIEAPLLGYGLVYLPLHAIAARLRRRTVDRTAERM